MSHLPLWFLGNIPLGVCDAAVKEFQAITPKDAAMGVDGAQIEHNTRNTNVRFAPNGHWFGGALLTHAMKANKECGWDFDITDHEAVQYAEYGPGQHYHWHVDNFPLSGTPVDRKVSVVCLLSDLSEFEAGELQLRLYSEYTAPLVKGTMIAFPSIIEHRVTPVIAGLRATATMWLSGPRFR